jgi:hypothetical protein
MQILEWISQLKARKVTLFVYTKLDFYMGAPHLCLLPLINIHPPQKYNIKPTQAVRIQVTHKYIMWETKYEGMFD